ncbi:MAG: VWA domain-containing protein [Lachnospiraceae bacterium]|nr:VWA domain-containing protein [Lachnospiraceae bacterium]
MGSGAWREDTFRSYAKKMNRTVGADGRIAGEMSNQEIFLARNLDKMLDPANVTRECCDSEEHPNTIPVILALDVTGSMGNAAVEVAKQLNVIMTQLYEKVKDVEFMIMGIGDFVYDRCPLQVSQFESDIRIAEQLDKVFFEFGGGGNKYESYTAAWYFGARHTRLDAWKRGKKGMIITMGDERINPYLPKEQLQNIIGDKLQGDVETKDLYAEVTEKYELYHLNVRHGRDWDLAGIRRSWKEYLDEKHFREVNLNSLTNEIIDIVTKEAEGGNENEEEAFLTDIGMKSAPAEPKKKALLPKLMGISW